MCTLPYFKCIVELKEQHQHENNLRTKIVVRNTDFRNFSSFTYTLWCILSIFSVYCLPNMPPLPLIQAAQCSPTICILYSNVEYVPFENKCRNNQMDDNIFDKRLLKRNCFMINKHFNRHYIWIVINVILSKASPVFQEKNQYMYLCLFCMLKSMLTLERVKSHILLSA